uniref:cytosine permease n=1 Tax=uncultured Psychrobacter sp. TaxID=259303 RepID=UPI002622EB5D|nr:cytosine permease [uncultured Psychrobacter sp.]
MTVGALWLSVISKIGIVGFVNVVGAIIAPFFGILVIDYYIIRRQNINMNDLFSAQPTGAYYYTKGWNIRGLIAFTIGALIYWLLMRKYGIELNKTLTH